MHNLGFFAKQQELTLLNVRKRKFIGRRAWYPYKIYRKTKELPTKITDFKGRVAWTACLCCKNAALGISTLHRFSQVVSFHSHVRIQERKLDCSNWSQMTTLWLWLGHLNLQLTKTICKLCFWLWCNRQWCNDIKTSGLKATVGKLPLCSPLYLCS